MKNVFVVQETGKNIAPAREFGNICVMLQHQDVSAGPKRMQTVITTFFESRNLSPEDYLLCIGDPVAIGIATHLALKNTKGRINMLRWDRTGFQYEVIKLELQ